MTQSSPYNHFYRVHAIWQTSIIWNAITDAASRISDLSIKVCPLSNWRVSHDMDIHLQTCRHALGFIIRFYNLLYIFFVSVFMYLLVSASATHFGSRAFAVAGPKAWNQLPAHLRTLETVGPFKKALKTYLHSIQWLSQIVSHAAPL